MAERKSGPVKPPVIDLTARDAGKPDPKPSGKAAVSGSAAPKGTPSKPEPSTFAETGAAPETADLGRTDSEPAAEEVTRPAPETASKESAATPAKPAAASSSGTTGPSAPKPEPLKPQSSSIPPAGGRTQSAGRSPAPFVFAAIGGGVLGVVLTLGVAYMGWFPPVAPNPDPAPRLEAIEAEIGTLGSELATQTERLAGLEAADVAADERLAGLEGDLAAIDAARADTETALADLGSRVDGLGASPQGDEIGALEDEIAALGGRIDALAAGAEGQDAGLGETLETLQRTLSTLQRSAAANEARIGELETALADANAALAEQAEAAPAPSVQLVPAIAALEGAIAAGRPFAAEIEAVSALAPAIAVPAELVERAPAGLLAHEAIRARFDAVLPAMIAARPGTGEGGWAQDFAGWAQGVLALRPSGELEGDTPDAILSRLEAALARGDMGSAETLLAALPEPMQRAAGDLPQSLAGHAEADAFIAALRAETAS
ncbi:hypothetical protein EMQ25_14620 [Arsenicitalea aurantiaca]|uniref:Uncharacterized protein n=1 Tax=Arsenicitalea aurantiaca TaxID=1783274 RepID=A0A433X5M8_9HYPH|nr:hypothetical protein [Arsenicitalea aurantiaca]RUT29351.1 hypothetical protein EMQ25_14620 [Arsenicitalea aurantiaca]